MTYTLTISSQGQMILPKDVRKAMKVKPGDRLNLYLKPDSLVPTAIIEPANISWVDRVAGTAKGIYGDADKYIENERKSWDH